MSAHFGAPIATRTAISRVRREFLASSRFAMFEQAIPSENRSRTEGAMGQAEDSAAEADDVGSGTEEDCGGAEGTVGEGEESCVEKQTSTTPAFSRSHPR